MDDFVLEGSGKVNPMVLDLDLTPPQQGGVMLAWVPYHVSLSWLLDDASWAGSSCKNDCVNKQLEIPRLF